MGQEEAAEAALVLNEACSNAIRHGSPRGEIDRVSITLKTSDRAIAADVTDSGRGIGRARCGSGRRKGLGMLLMHVLADSVELIKNSSGTTVRLVKQSKDTLGVHESESAGLRDVSRN
jgi:two-component sensor histidine kinase